MYKILIVDDKEENHYLLQSIFGTEEFRIISAKNGREALEIARNEHPDFIISDILMPVMDGFQLCRECKRDEHLNNIYFIFYTATYLDDKDEEFALSLGAQKFLRKPLEPEVLLEIVRGAVTLTESKRKELFRKPEFPENEIYKLYSERLVSKLEDKNLDLEKEIASHKRTEQELRESEERFAIAVEGTSDGLWDWDTITDFTFYSDRYNRMLGFEPGEMPLSINSWKNLLHPDDREQALKKVQEYLEGKTSYYDSTYRMKTKDSLYKWINARGKALFDESGKPHRFVGFHTDITEKKALETKLLCSKEKTEKSDKLKTAFLANLLHEIKTPLNAIVGFSALLCEPDVDSKTRHSYIDIIMNSSDHLLSIITDVIDISNIETGIVKIKKKGIILNSLLRSLYDQFLPKVREKGISLVTELALTDDDSIIMADNTKLTQIISNLLANAIKFTHKGQIRFGYSVNDRLIRLFVADTGIGIPKEHQTRVFDRFFQIENPASNLYGGTGLGLAICKAYVELLGGEISLSSIPGTGSTFYFTIPYEKPSAIQKPIPSVKTETDFVFSKKKKILVAEDMESNFRLISYFLARANTDIIRAWNGKEAVEKVKADKKIDLILMDLKMPVMDGYTAVKLIRELRPEIPIIGQSAYLDDKTRVMECGFNGFISKPFDKYKLLSVIKEFI
jgi:PAS domain S-box-containing protein